MDVKNSARALAMLSFNTMFRKNELKLICDTCNFVKKKRSMEYILLWVIYSKILCAYRLMLTSFVSRDIAAEFTGAYFAFIRTIVKEYEFEKDLKFSFDELDEFLDDNANSKDPLDKMFVYASSIMDRLVNYGEEITAENKTKFVTYFIPEIGSFAVAASEIISGKITCDECFANTNGGCLSSIVGFGLLNFLVLYWCFFV